MKRDRDLDALAEAIKQSDQRSWLGRQVDRALAKLGRAIVKAIPFALFSVAAGVLLVRTGVDLGRAFLVVLYGSPVLAVGVVMFVVHAWGQNTGLTYTAPASDLAMAEPGQADPVGQPGQVEVAIAADLAKPAPVQPARPTTVTVTVLPKPVAELSAAADQDQPAWGTPDYTPEREEEEIA